MNTKALSSFYISLSLLFSFTPSFGFTEDISAAQVSKDFTAAAKKAIPAVVSVQVEILSEADGDLFDFFQDDFWRQFFGAPSEGKKSEIKIGQGSGVLVSSDGYILTNNHVVTDAKEIKVRLNDEREFDAKVVGKDPNSDLAVIKIDAENLPFLKLGNSDALEVGQWVIAVGNPLGLQASLTVGVVSAKGRDNLDLARIEDFIQTDAAINRGNSGGPLLNLDAEIVGINTALASSTGGYMGIGFAIPSNLAKVIMDQLISKGKFTRGYLGVTLQPVDFDLAQAFGLPHPEGGLVADVAKGSPAEKAGIRTGDVILKFNGQQVDNIGSLRNSISLMQPGSSVDLTVKRGSETLNYKIQIAAFPSDGSEKPAPVAIEQSSKLGIDVEPLNAELREKLGFKDDKGVIITRIDPNSPAVLAGLKKGILIISVNQKPVNTPDEFYQEVKLGEPKGILLLVKQGTVTRYVLLKTH